MKVKSIKNLALEVNCVKNMKNVKGGYGYGEGSILIGGGGSRPMRPTMAGIVFDIQLP